MFVDLARMIDFASIGVLMWLIHKLAPIKNGGDFLGTAFLSFILYAVFKLPYMLFLGGFTFPVSKEPTIHLISGMLSIPTLLIVFGILTFCKCEARRRRI